MGEALISYTDRNFLCAMPCAYILSCSYSFADNRSRGWRERCSRLLHFPKITLLEAFILYRRSCVNIHTLIFCTSSTFVEILYNIANMCALVWWCGVVFSISYILHSTLCLSQQFWVGYELFIFQMFIEISVDSSWQGISESIIDSCLTRVIVLYMEIKNFHRRLVVKNVLKFLVKRMACLARKFLLSQLSKTDTVGTQPNFSY